MILAEFDDRIRFVTQPDHAALAGRLAERWGGSELTRATPTAAVRLAVYAHDDGWWPRDRRPRRNADGSPQAFYELPPTEWIDLYGRGIDDVARVDRYAGLLVSMHGSGLRRQRYGLSPSWGATPSAFREFVDREERRQRALAAELREDPDDDRLSAADVELLDAIHETGRPPGGSGGAGAAADSGGAGADGGSGTDGDQSRLWRNYRLLAALDALALRLCSATPPSDPGVSDAISVDRVPTEPGRADTTLTARPTGAAEYRLSPYPFRESPIVVNVPSRTVNRTSFENEETLLRQYYGAETRDLRIVCRPA